MSGEISPLGNTTRVEKKIPSDFPSPASAFRSGVFRKNHTLMVDEGLMKEANNKQLSFEVTFVG